MSGFKTKHTTRDKQFVMIKGPLGRYKISICMDLTWSPHLKGKNRHN